MRRRGLNQWFYMDTLVHRLRVGCMWRGFMWFGAGYFLAHLVIASGQP